MESYSSFAQVYDEFMDETPYQQWAERLRTVLGQKEINSGLVAELGCGTGNITGYLSANGYDMIGIDNSPEMLEIANQKKSQQQQDILYLLQDMQEFELYGTVRAIISVCDSINYIVEPDDLLTVFRLVNNYLDPGGLFVFDFNTSYKYRHILGQQTIAENREKGSFIWQNYYDDKERINEYDLTLFIKRDENKQQASYLKYEETHFQRAYTLAEIIVLLENAGLQLLATYDGYEEQPSHEKSERVLVVAQEVMKCGDK